MCGIYGSSLPESVAEAAVGARTRSAMRQMSSALSHRGPDRARSIVAGPASLGCTRLRIQDLTAAADGPLVSADGTVSVTCNGEIYNAPALRRRLAHRHRFETSCDLEVILPLYRSGGVSALERLEGMFALALWDRRAGELVLMRDRAGEKPLFYARLGSGIWFASEMQALLELPEVSRELDPVALRQYLRLGYVRSPATIFRDIRQVPAGTTLVLGDGYRRSRQYWSPGEAADRDEPPTAQVLLEELRRAVRLQAPADVPRGIYLSGGLDSSLLAALMAEEVGSSRLMAFVARFEKASYDEGPWAERVARRLRLRSHSILVNEATLRRAWDAVIEHIADPLADPALLPTYLLGRAAAARVKVVFSGEGADELFGGYPTYLGHRLIEQAPRVPEWAWRGIRAAARALPTTHSKVSMSFLVKRFTEDARRPWRSRHERWFGPCADLLLADPGAAPAGAAPGDGAPATASPSVLRAAMLHDYTTYLRDNLLVKLDRATMLSSVEPRAPFLDSRVTTAAWTLPDGALVRGFRTKALLKEAARAILPDEIVFRRKRGFSLPVAAWINGGLRAETDRLLDPKRLRRQGLLRPEAVTELLSEHRSRRADHSRRLWTVIHLQRWLERWSPSFSV